MRFSLVLRLSILVLSLTLFLTPLYSVYAQDRPTASATPRLDARALTVLQSQKQKLETAKKRFDDRLALMKVKIASREAQVKLKTDQFTNRAKAEVALRLNQTLNRINQNQTQQMTMNLVRMNVILDKVVTKVGGTASESAQVLSAKSAMETSHNAVELQAGKDYTINISTESAVRKDSQAMSDKLHTDLRSTRETVRAAKQAVMTAVRALLGEKLPGEGTGSATRSGVPAQ